MGDRKYRDETGTYQAHKRKIMELILKPVIDLYQQTVMKKSF
jgi:hypothetical protein